MRNGGKVRSDQIPPLSVGICQNSARVDIFIQRAPGDDNKTANANPADLMNRRWFPSVMRRTEGGGGVTAHPRPGFIIFFHILRAQGRWDPSGCLVSVSVFISHLFNGLSVTPLLVSPSLTSPSLSCCSLCLVSASSSSRPPVSPSPSLPLIRRRQLHRSAPQGRGGG